MVKDIKSLLLYDDEDGLDGDVVMLWDERGEDVKSGVQYFHDDSEPGRLSTAGKSERWSE